MKIHLAKSVVTYIYELMAMALNDMVSEVILTYATTYSTLDIVNYGKLIIGCT